MSILRARPGGLSQRGIGVRSRAAAPGIVEAAAPATSSFVFPRLSQGAAYRRDAAAMTLPAVGIAALFAAAAAATFIPLAPAQAAAYLRDARALQVEPIFVAPQPPATFPFPAATPQLQLRDAWAGQQPSVRVLQPGAAAAAVPFVAVTTPQRRAEEARREWEAIGPWFATFAPPDPFYVFAGPVVQPMQAHVRPRAALDAWEPFGPWAAPFVQPPSSPIAAPPPPGAAYLREQRAIAAPAAFYTPSIDAPLGGPMALPAAYLRELRAVPAVATLAIPVAPPSALLPLAPSMGLAAHVREVRRYVPPAVALLPFGVVGQPSAPVPIPVAAYLREHRAVTFWAVRFTQAGTAPAAFATPAVVDPQYVAAELGRSFRAAEPARITVAAEATRSFKAKE
jgi:hypothetical protein